MPRRIEANAPGPALRRDSRGLSRIGPQDARAGAAFVLRSPRSSTGIAR